MINLPAVERIKYDNLQWYCICEGKPKPEILYEMFVDELIRLYTEGAWVWDASTGEMFLCRVMLYAVLMDYKGITEVMRHMDVGGYIIHGLCQVQSQR